ncbi:MAG: START domain-containing protein [Myxococcota bacterium]
MSSLMTMDGRLLSLLCLSLGLFSTPIAATELSEPWQEILSEEGVTVWQAEVANSSLVKFRGVGIVNAPLNRIVAVVSDLTRRQEWQINCVESRVIESMTADHMIGYYRLKGPPLISDRDVVFDAVLTTQADLGIVRIDFNEVTDIRMPLVDGVERMPKLHGYWKMQWLAESVTEVTYEVQADPGGWIPDWLVNHAAKSFPHGSIVRLRRQVKRRGYEKQEKLMDGLIRWEHFRKVAP